MHNRITSISCYDQRDLGFFNVRKHLPSRSAQSPFPILLQQIKAYRCHIIFQTRSQYASHWIAANRVDILRCCCVCCLLYVNAIAETWNQFCGRRNSGRPKLTTPCTLQLTSKAEKTANVECLCMLWSDCINNLCNARHSPAYMHYYVVVIIKRNSEYPCVVSCRTVSISIQWGTEVGKYGRGHIMHIPPSLVVLCRFLVSDSICKDAHVFGATRFLRGSRGT